MFERLKGIKGGTKLANECTNLCKDIVNFLITNNVEVKLSDTAFVLGECYAFCLFALRRPKMSETHLESIIIVAHDPVKEWLSKAYSLANQNYGFETEVKNIVDGYIKGHAEWVKELMANHSELRGKGPDEWLPAAISQFAIHVDFYVHERFGKSPYKFSFVLIQMLSDRVSNLRKQRELSR